MKELSDFKIGDHVIVTSVNDSDYSFLLGKAATVVKSDVPHKIKVEFDDQWCGYFLPGQLDILVSEPSVFTKMRMKNIVDASEKVGKLRCLIDVSKFVLNGGGSTDDVEEAAPGSLYAQYEEAIKERNESIIDFWRNFPNVKENK